MHLLNAQKYINDEKRRRVILHFWKFKLLHPKKRWLIKDNCKKKYTTVNSDYTVIVNTKLNILQIKTFSYFRLLKSAQPRGM